MVQTGKWNKVMVGPPTEKMLRQNYHSAVITEKPRMSGGSNPPPSTMMKGDWSLTFWTLKISSPRRDRLARD